MMRGSPIRRGSPGFSRVGDHPCGKVIWEGLGRRAVSVLVAKTVHSGGNKKKGGGLLACWGSPVLNVYKWHVPIGNF